MVTTALVKHGVWWADSVLLRAALCLPAASLGPLNWARWGYGCVIGVALFGTYGICEYFYNKKHGPPEARDFEDDEAPDDVSKGAGHLAPQDVVCKDLEAGKASAAEAEGAAPAKVSWRCCMYAGWGGFGQEARGSSVLPCSLGNVGDVQALTASRTGL